MAAIAVPLEEICERVSPWRSCPPLRDIYDCLIQWPPREDDKGGLLAAMDCPVKQTVKREEVLKNLRGL